MSDGIESERKRTILIVEDLPVTRKTVVRFLEPLFPGCEFLEADAAASALLACAARRPQVILMDICLPDLSGIALAARVKAMHPDCRIVFLSYLTGQSYVDAAMKAGGVAYVPKDQMFSELVPALARALADVP